MVCRQVTCAHTPAPVRIHMLEHNVAHSNTHVRQMCCAAFLKSHGALLNAVKPEMLLEYDDFVRWG